MLKKYYSIGEVSQILGVPTSMLRKLDSIRSMDAKITRIRGRRYYTKANITGAARLLTELRKAEFRLDRTQLLDYAKLDELIFKMNFLIFDINKLIKTSN